MPKYCASGLCKNNAKDNPNKKFALFVQIKGKNANEARAQVWIRRMGRQNFSLDDIKSYTYVCEDHFDKDVELDYRKVSLSIIINQRCLFDSRFLNASQLSESCLRLT